MGLMCGDDVCCVVSGCVGVGDGGRDGGGVRGCCIGLPCESRLLAISSGVQMMVGARLCRSDASKENGCE